MAEFLRLLWDLSNMSKHLPIGILKHHFNNYDPAQSKSLKDSIVHFHMSELESSDYRSAYHQFCDWLYGWSVSDGADDEFTKRPPRDINMEQERETTDAARLMNTFETLTSVSIRHLKICYAEIEALIPNIGKGIKTGTKTPEEYLTTDLTANTSHLKEKLWGNTLVNSMDLQLGEFKGFEMEPEIEVKKAGSAANSNASSSSDLKNNSDVLYERTIPADNAPTNGNVLSRQGSFKFSVSRQPSLTMTAEAKPPQLHDAEKSADREDSQIDKEENQIEISQSDINIVYAKIDQCTEYALLAMCGIAAILGFAELLGEKDTFMKANLWAHEISQEFVSNTLKSVWDLLHLEIPKSVTLAKLRDPMQLKVLFLEMAQLRQNNGVVPKLPSRKIYQKFSTLHDTFKLVDIHIFPNFAQVHKEGVKCANFSAFDSSLWLTGGYDCIIRITDIRQQNKHICLAQYVGHKSIVTDVHFTREDTHIVSCSFDRTVKVWNSQTATIDKNLVGHIDAVTTCDVSSDGRYIASGSLDNSIRFWDFNTGECITVIKKHSRWIKKVRFSPDCRYLASAGMDRRVFIWDTKILVNSRSPSHSRCFDSFNDYVLDMILIKPSYLLTTSRDSMLHLFDYMTGQEIYSYSLQPSWACTLSLSENGEYFATGSFDNNINIFRTRDFVKVREIRAFNLGIMCVRFPNDLSYVLVGTAEGFIQQIPL
ncbi:Pre-mRNA-processing factor 17 [Terramyces sp. JEL0728]|nr:Pre-mRNA-processing factor 17 [Terramyces sp. JEL0728]